MYEESEPKSKRGFASMPKDKVRKIAKLGGIAAHKMGTGYEWTVEEARRAGRKGGIASRGGRGKLKEENNDTKP